MVETRTAPPRHRSGLEGTPRPERADAALRLADASNRHSVWSLRAKDPDIFKAALDGPLPTAMNRFEAGDDRAIAKLGPDEWLLLAPSAEHDALTSKLVAATEEAGAAIDLSERFAAIELRGAGHARRDRRFLSPGSAPPHRRGRLCQPHDLRQGRYHALPGRGRDGAGLGQPLVLALRLEAPARRRARVRGGCRLNASRCARRAGFFLLFLQLWPGLAPTLRPISGDK